MSVEAWRPRLPAEQEGVDGGGSRPEIVLTPAENLLQILSAQRGRRWGCGVGARRMDVVGETGTCMVMNAAALWPPVPSSHQAAIFTLSTPSASGPVDLGGG